MRDNSKAEVKKKEGWEAGGRTWVTDHEGTCMPLQELGSCLLK